MKASGAALEAGPALGSGFDPTPLLVVNPLSFRSARGLGERAAALAAAHGAEVIRVADRAAMDAAVDRILARRQRHVAVLAGDGTVHAVVERLAALPPGRWRPELLVLPGGRSNVTAGDLLPGLGALDALRTAFGELGAGSWQGSIVERPVLRVEHAGAAPHFGFLLGGAAVDAIIRLSHADRSGSGGALRTGHLSTPWLLARLAARALVGRSGIRCPRLAVQADGLGLLEGPVSVLLATTLLHRRGILDPYAERAGAGLRVSAVAADARGLWPRLPRLVSGRYAATMNLGHGYLSGRSERVQVVGLASYVIDGEKFDADPAEPLVVSVGPRLRFFGR